MRKILLIILLTGLFVSQTIAQGKSQRRIYLWDVTLSMKGYKDRTPDIYDDVVDFLRNEINSLTDESTEIVVLPFQERILDNWVDRATKTGKNNIISKIKQYNNVTVTNTNIVQPIKTVQSQFIKNDRHNMLFLLTDGKQTGGNSELLTLIRNWEQYAQINDTYAVYVMLTKEAFDQEVVNVIDETEHIDVITEPGKVDFIDLQPAELVKFNIKDDNGKPATITLTCKKDFLLPDGITVSVKSLNDTIVNVSTKSEIKNQKILFDLKYDYDELKYSLPESTKIPLKLEIVNSKEIKERTGKIILLNPKEITMELINKPEKTLRIHVKK